MWLAPVRIQVPGGEEWRAPSACCPRQWRFQAQYEKEMKSDGGGLGGRFLNGRAANPQNTAFVGRSIWQVAALVGPHRVTLAAQFHGQPPFYLQRFRAAQRTNVLVQARP